MEAAMVKPYFSPSSSSISRLSWTMPGVGTNLLAKWRLWAPRFTRLINLCKSDFASLNASVKLSRGPNYCFSIFRNSSLDNPACWIIARSVPFLIGSWRGTVSLCFPSVKNKWLPFWLTTLNPALLSVLITFRQEIAGSFSDSYFHQFFLTLKLVNLFRESFKVAFDGFFMLARASLRFSPSLIAPGSSIHCAEYPPSDSSLRIIVNFRPLISTITFTNEKNRVKTI